MLSDRDRTLKKGSSAETPRDHPQEKHAEIERNPRPSPQSSPRNEQESLRPALRPDIDDFSHARDVLPESTVALLSALNSEDYRYKVLSKKTQFGVRTVVLLGETHVKSEQAFQEGAVVVDQFSHRALENVQVERYWLGSIFTKVLDIAESWYTSRGDPDFTDGSTIDYSRTNDHLRRDPHDGDDRLGGLQDQGPLEQRSTIIPNRNTPEATSNFELEEDHQPSLLEQLSLAYPLSAPISWAYLPLSFALPTNIVTQTLFWGAALPITIATIAGPILADKLRSRFEDTPFLTYLEFGGFAFMIRNRDRTFSKKIDEIIDSHEEVETLLSILGEGHIAGTSKCLVDQYGWKVLRM